MKVPIQGQNHGNVTGSSSLATLNLRSTDRTMPKPMTPSDYAGKWEMIKDTAGKEKRGLCLTIYPAGCCLVSAFALLCYTTMRHECSSTKCPFSPSAGAVLLLLSSSDRLLRHFGTGIYGQVLLPLHVRTDDPDWWRQIRQDLR